MKSFLALHGISTPFIAGALRRLQRKVGDRQATVPPLAPSDTKGEAGAPAPAPASPFMCTSRLFAGISGNFFCTRNLGHSGKHEYHGIAWVDDEAAR